MLQARTPPRGTRTAANTPMDRRVSGAGVATRRRRSAGASPGRPPARSCSCIGYTTIGRTIAPPPRISSKRQDGDVRPRGDDADRQPDDEQAEADDGADRHRPELEALVAAVPADPARSTRLRLVNQPVEEGPSPAAPRAAPADAAPQHRRQRRPGHVRTLGRPIRETRTDASRPGGGALLRRRRVPRARRRRVVAAARRLRPRPERRRRRRRARGPGHPHADRDRHRRGDGAARSACRSPTSRRRSTSWPRLSAGAALMRDIVADSHAKLIGAREEPVQITGRPARPGHPQRGRRQPAAGDPAGRGGQRAVDDPDVARVGRADRRHRRRGLPPARVPRPPTSGPTPCSASACSASSPASPSP